MDYTSYQCAAAADVCCRRENGEPLAGRLLVLDLDHCAAGLCSCTDQGVIAQEAELPGVGEPSFFPALANALGGTAEQWLQQWLRQEQRSARAYSNYLRARRAMDPVLLEAEGGGALHCRQAEELFAPAAAQLETLLGSVDALLAQRQVDMDALRILLIGRHARVFPAEAVVRVHFGGSAVMPDLRFVPHRDELPPDGYVQRGQALYAAKRVEDVLLFGHDVGLALQERLPSGELQQRTEPLALAKTPLEELQRPAYCPPFYAKGAQALQLVVDGAVRGLPLPFTPGAVVQAAVTVQGGQAFLNLIGAGDAGAPTQLPVHIEMEQRR